jgi:hypothetical protein
MELGYQGYWTGSPSAMSNVIGGFNQSGMAIQHSGSILASSTGGPSYNATLLNTTCIVPGSKWEVSVQVRLVTSILKQDAKCDIKRSCPSIRIAMNEAVTGRAIVDLTSRNYTSGAWKKNAYNTLTATFQLPASTSWSGTVGAMSIGLRGYASNTRNLIFDDFYVRKMA